ncbi:MAG: hypothetical protein OEL75_01135 [Kiritimatiellaceae bacterium]|nr:hypothetical protein [Kiritimatiellaceae bacterium]
MLIPHTAFISPGGGELLLVMLVLILLFGAKDAPRILRTIQSFLDKMQRTAASFRYKIMYGDLHDTSSVSSPPYDLNDDDPYHAETSKNSEPETPDSTLDPETEHSELKP